MNEPTNRLDQALVVRGLVATRSKARDLIVRGKISVNGVVADKPAQTVPGGSHLAVAADHPLYVSRGGEKLAAALDALGFDPVGRIGLDVGASTGGFTEVLLQRGALKVYAVDVGRDQLHRSIRDDARVVVHEATDARALDRTLIAEPIEMLVADVSFISLTKALPGALALTVSGAWLVALIKPQFEVGRDGVGKGGIVREAAARQGAVDGIRRWLGEQPGWQITGVVPSPIRGGDGNEEFLLGARRS